MKYLTLFLILLAVGCSQPQPEPIDFDFRGVKIGDPVPEHFKQGMWVNADLSGGKSNVGVYGFQDDSIYVKVLVLDDTTQGFILRGGDDLKKAYVAKYGEHHFNSEGEVCWRTTDGVPLRFRNGQAMIATDEYRNEELAAIERKERKDVNNIKL